MTKIIGGLQHPRFKTVPNPRIIAASTATDEASVTADKSSASADEASVVVDKSSVRVREASVRVDECSVVVEARSARVRGWSVVADGAEFLTGGALRARKGPRIAGDLFLMVQGRVPMGTDFWSQAPFAFCT